MLSFSRYQDSRPNDTEKPTAGSSDDDVFAETSDLLKARQRSRVCGCPSTYHWRLQSHRFPSTEVPTQDTPPPSPASYVTRPTRKSSLVPIQERTRPPGVDARTRPPLPRVSSASFLQSQSRTMSRTLRPKRRYAWTRAKSGRGSRRMQRDAFSYWTQGSARSWNHPMFREEHGLAPVLATADRHQSSAFRISLKVLLHPLHTLLQTWCLLASRTFQRSLLRFHFRMRSQFTLNKTTLFHQRQYMNTRIQLIYLSSPRIRNSSDPPLPNHSLLPNQSRLSSHMKWLCSPCFPSLLHWASRTYRVRQLHPSLHWPQITLQLWRQPVQHSCHLNSIMSEGRVHRPQFLKKTYW